MLSQDQQKIIEDSLWIVNTALKKQGLEGNEDLKQSAILYLCQTLNRFDESKGVKWSTYAYRNIFLYIKRTHAEELLWKSKCLNIDEINEDYFLIDEDFSISEEDFGIGKQILSMLNDIERVIFILKSKGYSSKEIAKETGLCLNKVKSITQEVQNRFSGIILRENIYQGEDNMIILTQRQKDTIKARKKNGEPNSQLMKDYKLTYAELRDILDDGGVENQYVQEEER